MDKPNGRPQYYVSECPDTKRQFLVEHGRDNNLVELTMQNAEIIRRRFLQTRTPDGDARRKTDLLAFLQAEHKRYRTEILPQHPDADGDGDMSDEMFCNEYQNFDDQKNEFLESLWDVISQHFADENK